MSRVRLHGHGRSAPGGTRWTFHLRPARASPTVRRRCGSGESNFDRWRLQHDPLSRCVRLRLLGLGVRRVLRTTRRIRASWRGRLIVDSPLQVTFVLAQPSGTFLRNVADAIVRDRLAYGDQARSASLRTTSDRQRPTCYASGCRDDHITLEREPGVHGASAPASIKTVVIRDIPDQATSVLSIQKGELAMLYGRAFRRRRGAGRAARHAIVRQPSNNLAYLAMKHGEEAVRPTCWCGARSRRRSHSRRSCTRSTVRATVPGDNWTRPGCWAKTSASRFGRATSPRRNGCSRSRLAARFCDDACTCRDPGAVHARSAAPGRGNPSQLKDAGIIVTLEPLEFGVFLAKIQNGEHPMC